MVAADTNIFVSRLWCIQSVTLANSSGSDRSKIGSFASSSTKSKYTLVGDFKTKYDTIKSKSTDPGEMRCIGYQLQSRVKTAIVSSVNMGWQRFTNDKYWKSFSKLFHITWRLRLVFQLNDCVLPKYLTQYLSGYNPMIEWTDLSDE